MLKADLGAACSKRSTSTPNSWKKSAAEVQQALKTNAIGYRDQMSTQALARARVRWTSCQGRRHGTVLSAEQRAAWAKSMPNVAKQWAEGLEAKGIPGKKILADLHGQDAGGQPADHAPLGQGIAADGLEIVSEISMTDEVKPAPRSSGAGLFFDGWSSSSTGSGPVDSGDPDSDQRRCVRAQLFCMPRSTV